MTRAETKGMRLLKLRLQNSLTFKSSFISLYKTQNHASFFLCVCNSTKRGQNLSPQAFPYSWTTVRHCTKTGNFKLKDETWWCVDFFKDFLCLFCWTYFKHQLLGLRRSIRILTNHINGAGKHTKTTSKMLLECSVQLRIYGDVSAEMICENQDIWLIANTYLSKEKSISCRYHVMQLTFVQIEMSSL